MLLSASLRRLSRTLASLRWAATFLVLTALPALAQVDIQFKNFESVPASVAAGGVYRYVVEVENNNLSPAANSTLSVPLPTGVVFVAVTTDKGSCAHTALTNTVSCTFGTLNGTLSGGSPAAVNIDVRAGMPGPDTISVTGTVGTSSSEVNTVNNVQPITTTVVNGANLSFQTYAAGPTPSVIAGANATYTAIVQNAGPNIAVDAFIEFKLAVGLSYQSKSGSNWTCNVQSGDYTSGEIVRCSYAASIGVAANAATLTWQAKVAGNQVGTLSTSGTITSTTLDGDANDNVASAAINVVAGTDLQMVKSVSANPVIGGTPVTFTLQVNNLGPHPASGLTVTDTIPTGFTALNTTGTNTSDWSCNIVGQLLTCTRPTLAVGSATPILINATAPDNALISPTGTAASNSATVVQTSQESNAGNNTGTVNFNMMKNGVDMRPTGFSRGPNPVAQGSNITTQFAVHNDGPLVATGVIRASFQLSTGETYVSGTGTGWTCVPSTTTTGLINCERAGPVAINTSTPSITFITTATTAGTLTANACVSQGAGLQPIEGEINPANDCTSGGVSATSAVADLQVTKSVVPASPATLAAAADTLTYSLTVTNLSTTTDAGQVTLTDPIPMYSSSYTGGGATRPATGVTVTSAAGATCTVGATVTCDWASFPANTARTVTIEVKRPMQSGTFTNRAYAYSSTIGDPNRANNEDTATAVVEGAVDVAVTQKTASPDPARGGVDITYTIQARNLGPSAAADFVVTDTFTSIPGGLTFVSVAGSNGGICTAFNTTTNSVSCNFGTVGATGVRTMTVVVRPNFVTETPVPTRRFFANTASVTTSTYEAASDKANNEKSLSVEIKPAEVDVLIEETDLKDPVGFDTTTPANNLIVYRIRVTNNGPSYATGVTFTDKWTSPPSTTKTLTYLCDLATATATSTCASPPATQCSNATPTVTCVNPSDMASGAVWTRYLIYRVDTAPATTGDSYRKDAAVTANEKETLSGNNTAVELTTVRMLADMQAVSKVASKSSVTLNEPFNYVVTVRNNGPSTAIAARLSDSLPSGMELTGAPTSTVGTCTGISAATSFTCAFGDMANAGTAIITVPVRVTAFPTGGTISNSVTVATDSIDTVPANDSTTGPVTVTKSSIAGSVYIDTNDDGQRQGGETGINNVTLTLSGKDTYNNTVNITRQTNGSGNYLFDNLTPSDSAGYTITETHPTAYFDGKERVGTGGATQGASGTVVTGSKATDAFTGIVLAANTALTSYDFGELANASIAGRVWYDRSNDGLINSGETTFLSGVTVRLDGVDDLGTTIATQMALTNGSGAYSFTNLRPGTYTVTEVQPASHLPGRAAVGTGANGGAAGTADNTLSSPTFGNAIAGIQLRGGDAAIEYNFGEILPGSVAGKVFYDINNNGTQDTGEPAINNVTVTLTGTDYLGRTITPIVVQTNTTGDYIFPTVLPGTYTITETNPVGYLEGKLTVGTLAGTGSTNTVGNTSPNSTFTGVVVKPQDAGTGYIFGEVAPSLSGFVYDDLNDNGIKEGGEAGIPNVILTLSGCVSMTAQTDNTGAYRFGPLPACPAGYTVTQTQPTGYSDGKDTVGSVGGLVANDIISGIVIPGFTEATAYNFGEHNNGQTNLTCSTVTPGTRNIREPFNWTFTVRNTTSVGAPVSRLTSTLPAGLELTGIPTTNAAGGSCTGAAGGNAVACQLGYINGLASVTVTAPVRLTTFPTGGTLTATSTVATDGADQIATDNSCNAPVTVRQATLAGTVFEDPNNDGIKQSTEVGIANVTLTLTGKDLYGNDVNVTKTTKSDGTYLFDALAPADATGYTVTETQPNLFADGKDTVGSVGGTASASDVVTGIRLLEGINATGYDFAEISQGIAGSVYVDSNDDGIRDATEKGIPNVTIRITGTSSTNAPVDVTTTTDTDGRYLFGGIPPANAAGYTITETQPAAWTDGKDTAGNVGGTAANDVIRSIVLPSGRIATGYDFGERGGKLCGYVYVDLNNNGIKDRSESGIPNVTLTLAGTDINGAAVMQTAVTQGLATGATDIGRYCFVDLPVASAGGYTITETQPADYNDGKVTPGTLGGTSATNVIATIPFTTAGLTGENYNFGEVPTAAAALSGFVWLDSNHDRGRNEPTGRASWTVELIRGDIGGAYSVVATTTTAPDGAYRFDGLPPGGGYSVLFRSPNGNYVYGYLTNITLTANTELAEQNQPIDPSGVVYDVLTRQPVPGATVRLVGPAGFNPTTHLVGGSSNVSQVVGATGEYRYLLLPGSPTGTYRLEVTVPTGYVQRISTALPPCTATLTVGAAATPSLVQRLDTAPPTTQRQHDPASCPTTTAGLATGNDSTQYYLSFLLGATSTHVINNHIPIEAIPTTTALVVTKTTPKLDVTRGELVPYTISIRNNQDVRQTDIALVDMIPPGFRYRAGSAIVGGTPREPAINGRELKWPPVTIERGATLQVRLMLTVGTGVSEGEYVNQAWAINAFSNVVASNIATATVRITPDPNFDCSDIIGKVFDDKNRNGVQDDGEPGIANARLATVNGLLVTTDPHGRFHITCADVPNEQRGSNFVLKLDERTLPTGFRLTTPNPGVVVLTRGKMAKLNFGVAVHRVVRIDVMDAAFEPGSVTLRPSFAQNMSQVFPALAQEKSVLRIGYGRTSAEDTGLAAERVRSLQRYVADAWRNSAGGYHLVIETEVYSAGAAK